jgi:large subunit ribosomal protein L18
MSNVISQRRKQRVRFRISKRRNTRLRLTVFRSSQHIYAQLIDDSAGVTLVSASSLDKELRVAKKEKAAAKKQDGKSSTSAVAMAEKVGALLAARAKEKNLSSVVFDRGEYLYHGCVKALAESARAGGLSF